MMGRKILLVCVSTLAIAAVRADDESKTDDRPTFAALLEAHNRERAREKLPALEASTQLETAAIAHSRDMASAEKMSHEGTDKSTPSERIKKAGYRYRRVGENVAVEYRDVAAVMRGWMNSPEHKKNILGDYTQMGGAVARDFDGKTYWCVDFGTPLPPRPDLTPDLAERELIDTLNDERKKAGKRAVKQNRILTVAAQRHADGLAAKDKVAAKDDDGLSALDRVDKVGYRYRRLAEEIASGLDTPADVVKAWLERPTDRENALGDFAEVGVGYAVAKSERTYWCVIFARPAR